MTLQPVTAAEIPFASQLRETASYRLLDDVALMRLPDPEWIVDGVIPRRGTIGLVGLPGTYKTTTAADLQVCIATGQAWHGHRVIRRGATIHLSAEDPSGFKLRVAASKRARGLALDEAVGVYCFPDPIDLREPLSVGKFIRFVQDQAGAFEVLVIDTYAAVTPGSSENSSEDTTVAMAAARQLGAALDVAVILVHHTNASGTRERGHSSMRGDLDTLIMLEAVDDVLHVRCAKQRNGPEFKTFLLKPVAEAGGGIVLRPAAEVLPTRHLTPQQMQILEALRDVAGQDGVTKAQWKDATKGLNCSERTFYKMALRLEELGYAVKVGTSHFRVGTGK